MTARTRISLITLMAFVATTALTGCGVRGKLSPPPGETAVKTDQLPPENPKHRPFILDKILK